MQPTISVIITNWNGSKLLQRNLPSILKFSPLSQEIIVADDASTDDSLQYLSHLQKTDRRLRILSHRSNLGFIKNSNSAVKKSSSDLVVLLNNDIQVFPGYIENSLKHFSKVDTFGVGFLEIGRPNWPKYLWQNGYLQYQPVENYPRTHITAWLSGGSSMLSRKLFLQLGGFDDIYSPFYSEDLDLGFRAWLSGYTLLWEPKSRVDHHHESTMSKFPLRFLNYVKERNRLLTVWRNITSPRLLLTNRLALISRVLFGPNYIKIVRAAHKQTRLYPPPIVYHQRTDIDVINLFSGGQTA